MALPQSPTELRNLNRLWAAAAAAFADRVAVAYGSRDYTFAELEDLIAATAAGLQQQFAVGPGDRVALVMPNCLPSVVCYLAVVRLGAFALPVNIRLKAEEMRFILGDAAPTVALAHCSLWDTVAEAVCGTELVNRLVGIEVDDPSVVSLTDLQSAAASPPPAADPPPEEVAAIIYTSGTTGLPKGALITHGNILFNIASTIHGHGFTPADVHLLAVPLFHVTGLNTLLPTALFQGATMVVTDRTAPRDLLELVQRHRVTTWFGVPTTMILLAQTPGLEEYDLGSLRLLAYSGAPMPLRAIEKLRALFPGVALHNFFGLTETTSVTTVLPDDQALVRPESVGLPPPGIDLRLVDDAGQELPPNHVGELLVRGPSVVKGYYNRPDATAETFVDGWLHTGDTAHLDDEGYLFLQGRKKEMIIVAGENVYPIEVENVLTESPDVLEAAVIGVPHAILGEVVKAVVVPRPGVKLDLRALKRRCVERLASYKVPQHFELRDTLPRNPSGKVMKRKLGA